MTNAQQASINALKWIASSSREVVVLTDPEQAHPGEYASLFVTVKVFDTRSKARPLPHVDQRFLVEAGGCVARIYE